MSVGDAIWELHRCRQICDYPLALEIGTGFKNFEQHAMTVIIGQNIRVQIYVDTLDEPPTPEAEEAFRKIVAVYPIGDRGFYREDLTERRQAFLARFSARITSCQVFVSSPFLETPDISIEDDGIFPELTQYK